MLRSPRPGNLVACRFAALRAASGRIAFAAALVALLCTLLAPLSATAEEGWAPPEAVWIEDTGQTVDKTFLTTWRDNGALLGNPISAEIRDRVKLKGKRTEERTLQYFQNAVLVSTYDDPRGDDWNVQALPIGAEILKLDAKRLKGIKLAETGSCDGFSSDDCRFFKGTEQTIKLGFKAYWDAWGGKQLIGAPITEEFVAKDGWTTQYFENGVLLWKADQGIVPRAAGKEMAAQKEVKTRAQKQPSDVPQYAEALFSPPQPEVVVTTPSGPGMVQGGDKEIVVSISQQYFWAYENGVVVIESYVSTGTAETVEVETPIGYWSVLTKVPIQTMEGTINGEYYRVEDVPNILYFDNLGNAIHGTYWHSNFGTPMSHGCVNLPLDVAAFVYNWAYVGMPVTVIA